MLAAWTGRGFLSTLMLPAAWVFAAVAATRRLLYRLGWLESVRLPVPVVVVGGIAVGGTGKTPLIIALARALGEAGRRPGVVSRGYGGRGRRPGMVAPDADPAEVGDEPLLIRRRAGCPVAVGADRVAAGRELLRVFPDCDLILCDDGLQHYRLRRDLEIAVLDGRGTGNGRLLPAGPLRESPARLAGVDALVANGDPGPLPAPGVRTFRMRLSGTSFHRLDDPDVTCAAADLAGRDIDAVAGIGHPERFFAHLRALGLRFRGHAFPDHHAYRAADLELPGEAILATEKDGVKLARLSPAPGRPPIWVLPVDALVAPDLSRFVLEKLDGRPSA